MNLVFLAIDLYPTLTLPFIRGAGGKDLRSTDRHLCFNDY